MLSDVDSWTINHCGRRSRGMLDDVWTMWTMGSSIKPLSKPTESAKHGAIRGKNRCRRATVSKLITKMSHGAGTDRYTGPGQGRGGGGGAKGAEEQEIKLFSSHKSVRYTTVE